jgi:hypothetical protein
VLGVSSNASDAELKAAFRKLATTHHPDRNLDDPEAAARFKHINNAYQVLSGGDSRRDYDRLLEAGVANCDPAFRNLSSPPPPDSQAASGRVSRVTPMGNMRPVRPSRTPKTAHGVAIWAIAGVAFAAVTGITLHRAGRAETVSSAEAQTKPALSFDDEMTIRMACSKYQTSGDHARHESCRQGLLAVAASTEVPSFEGVPPGRVMAIKVSCDSHQMRGDLGAHRKCLKEKLAEPH